MNPKKRRNLNFLGSALVFLSICGCKTLPPARICAALPPGPFAAFPADWCSSDGKELQPAVDNAGIALAAELSYLAYQSDEQIKALGTVEIGEVGIGPPEQYPHLFGTKYFLWHDTSGPGGPRKYLVIRGTADFENIFEDIDFAKIFDPDLGLWVHRGYALVARKLLERLESLQLPGQEPLWISGHSLRADGGSRRGNGCRHSAAAGPRKTASRAAASRSTARRFR